MGFTAINQRMDRTTGAIPFCILKVDLKYKRVSDDVLIGRRDSLEVGYQKDLFR